MTEPTDRELARERVETAIEDSFYTAPEKVHAALDDLIALERADAAVDALDRMGCVVEDTKDCERVFGEPCFVCRAKAEAQATLDAISERLRRTA